MPDIRSTPIGGRVTADDGYEVTTHHFDEDGVLHRVHKSRFEQSIMDENARVRANGGARTLSFGKMILQMSLAQYLYLIKVNPALNSPDKQEQKRAWLKLARDGGYRNLSTEDR